jgi:hypothetical protein
MQDIDVVVSVTKMMKECAELAYYYVVPVSCSSGSTNVMSFSEYI